MEPSISQYLDTREAAGFLGMSPCTLEAWRHRGSGPRFRKFGKSVRYALADLQAFAAAGLRENTSQVTPAANSAAPA